MKILPLFIILLFLCGPAGAQDLDQLRERAERFWAQRAAGNRAGAAAYVHPEGRDRFVRVLDPPILEARVSGLEFPSGTENVEVRARARFVLPSMGEIERTMRDEWTWYDDQWFLKLPEAGSPFTSSLTPPPEPVAPSEPLRFDFTTTQVDLGRAVQGGRLRGRLEFEADARRVLAIHPENVPGMAFGPPQWRDAMTGHIDFEWDTSLVWTDIRREVRFRIEGPDGESAEDSVTLQAGIEGRLRIEQIPASADAAQAGTLEIRLENLGSEPVTITSVSAGNPAFELEVADPTLIPGEPVRVAVQYPEMSRVTGAVLSLTFSGPILEANPVGIPLTFSQPEQAPGPATYTREQLEEIIQQNR